MLNTNNYNSSSCAFGEQIVSYLYDEAGAKEKIEFETHLSNCAACADELSGFGIVRSSINEWRNEEIFALELPTLEIPSLKRSKIAETSVVSTKSGMWLADLRGLFSNSPKLAFGSAAFALAIFCVGLMLVILNYSGNETIVEKENQNSEQILASNKINKENEPNILKPLDKTDSTEKDSSPAKFVAVDTETDEKSTVVKKDATVKVTKNTAKNKLAAPKLNNSEASANNLYKKNKNNNNLKQEVPKLSDFDEVEDNSLRLTDLFAEIDTK